MERLGLIINPVAGLGGKVGLKGSDGLDNLQKAIDMGAIPEAPRRALEALTVISTITEPVEILTYPGEMGEYKAREAGFKTTVIGSIEKRKTRAEDTIQAARAMRELDVDLLLFAGGDGTARDIYGAIGNTIPVLGIPAGVKMHSAVFAINPVNAGKAVIAYLENQSSDFREAEVMDIDEEAFRHGRLNARLFGYLKVPYQKRFVQNVKSGGYGTKEAITGIASEVISQMKQNVFYIIGPGTTTQSIMEQLGLPNTLLGVDVVLNRRLIASDVNESKLCKLVRGHEAKIVITVIGGQGYIFGRGNQQISAAVINKIGKENIIVVASKEKLLNLMPNPLLVDTGKHELDQQLCGYVRVITGFEDYVPYKVST